MTQSLFSRWLRLGTALALAVASSPAQERAGEVVVARVDGVPIYQMDVDRELAPLAGRLQSYAPDQAEAMLRQAERQIVQDLIGKLLLVNAAHANGLTVSQSEIDDRLKIVMKSIVSGGSPESFLQQAGISKADLTEDVRRNLLIQKLVDLKTNEIAPPTDEQITDFYETNRDKFFRQEAVECRQIFLDTEQLGSPAEVEAKRTQAEDLRKMLLENPGLDFAQVSQQKSEGPTAANGGYLGFIRQGDFLPEFTKAAFAQEVGKIGPVVQTQMGFHLIKVESRTPARLPPLAEIRDQVREGMLQRRKAELMKQLVDTWRKSTKIELLVPLEDSSEAPPATKGN
jgi:parvulin-like peptidyl-prolyl isomerase